jgi:hypothetical protein
VPGNPEVLIGSSPTKVLFVGDDASSTQMAEILLRRLVGAEVDTQTGGARPADPGGREDQMLVMMGLNPAHETPISVRMLNDADWVVILGTTLDVARVAGRRYEEWDLTTDDLEDLVEKLAVEIVRSAQDPADADGAETRLRRLAQRLRRRGRP